MYGNMGGYSDAVGAALSGVGGEFGADLGGSYGAGFEGAMGGWGADRTGLAQSSEGGATPVMDITPGMPISPQINSFVNALKTAMSFSPMQQAMKWGMSMMPEQMRAPTMNMNIDQLAAGVQAMGPGFELSPGLISSSFNGQMNVPMSGSGAHLGIASEIANIGGQNVHMGPGMTMNEDFFPGYGTNPFSGVAMADPGDPYIRKRRGTEMAAMIGP